MLKEPQTEKLIAQLFDNQPDSVVWFTPVFEESNINEVIDFEVQYCNEAAARLLKTHRTEMLGRRLRFTHLMDNKSTHLVYQQCRQAWQTGSLVEATYYSPGFDRYFTVQRTKVEGGILSITRDRSGEVRSELERREQEELYRQILNAAADGIMFLKTIRNGAGEITDFRIAHCNQKALESGRLPSNAVGRTILELLPHLKGSEQLAMHKNVVETGEPLRFETTFRNEDTTEYGWFIVSLTKMDDGVISTFVDVTEKKHREEEIESQKNLLRKILDASLDAVYTCKAVRDKDGAIRDFRFIQVNKKFRQQQPQPEMDVIGGCLLDLFPATGNTAVPEKLRYVIETGNPDRFEVHYQREGFERWYDVSAVRLDAADSVVVSFADVSDYKQALSILRQQTTLLDNILQHSANGISVTQVVRDQNGKVIDGKTILANDAAVKFTGIPREIYLGKTATELDPNIIDSPYYQLCLHTLETGTPQFTQYFLEFTKRWLEISISKLDNEHLITIFTDVTASRETQLQLERYLAELKRSNESLEEFTRTASHDLKEPIRKVQFFAERLKRRLEGSLGEEEKRVLERMEAAAARMKLLVDDLLEYSQVNEQPMKQEEIDLNAKLRIVQSDLELMIAEKDALIEAENLPRVKGIRRQLQQLFHNLLSNAIKYSRPGTRPVIVLRSRRVSGIESGLPVSTEDRDKPFHLIEVEDNGIGFEQQYAEKIFNVFTRLHGNSEYGGTGVGLAIVQKVVKNHKGYISAESTPGIGSIFRVLLPA